MMTDHDGPSGNPARPRARFALGQLVATPGALAAAARNPGANLEALIARHAAGDWGDVSS